MKTPEQQVKDMLDVAQVALAFIEAVKNPKVVEELKASLIDASSMSEQKKKEAIDADAAIAESHRIIALAEKKLNDVEVARGFATQQAAIQKQDVQKALDELEGERAALKTKVDVHMANVAAYKMKAEADQKAVVDRNKQLDARESGLDIRESNINASHARLSERETVCAAREAAVKVAEADLALRNQRVIDAAMGKIS